MSDALGPDTIPVGMAVNRAERAVRDAFLAAGIEGAETAARLFITRATGLDRTGLIIAGGRGLTKTEQASLIDFANRRLDREPVQRILGDAEFWGLVFRLSAATLVPRPDTETVVETALALYPDRDAAFVFADLGTGSGAILAAILKERPQAAGLGLDLSEEALATAEDNLVRLGLADRAAFRRASFAETYADGELDLVVSNPPYIATGEISGLADEVALHEPILALDGGDDGLAAYRALAPVAARALKPDGRIILEVGAGQADDVRRILLAAGFVDPKAAPDLTGTPRVVHARHP
jgi:release factor glutamine methyltransferase